MNETLFHGCLLAATSLTLLAQAPRERYGALKDALALSDSQLRQLQQPKPVAIAIDQPAGGRAYRTVEGEA